MKGYVENLIAGYQDMVRRRDYLKHEITVLKDRQVTEEDIISAMTFSHPDGERVQTSGYSDKVAKIAFVYKDKQLRANREVMRTRKEEYDSLCTEIAFLEDAIYSLSGDERDVMVELVFRNSTWDAAEFNLCMSRMTIQRIRKHAINSLVRYYQKREAQNICALLG